MNKYNLFYAVTFLFSLSTISNAASFDCAKASTNIEKSICANPELSKLDNELSAAYKQEIKKSNSKDDLKTQQREWLKNKLNKCTNESCIADAYTSRIAELNKQQDSAIQNAEALLKSTNQKKENSIKDALLRTNGAWVSEDTRGITSGIKCSDLININDGEVGFYTFNEKSMGLRIRVGSKNPALTRDKSSLEAMVGIDKTTVNVPVQYEFTQDIAVVKMQIFDSSKNQNTISETYRFDKINDTLEKFKQECTTCNASEWNELKNRSSFQNITNGGVDKFNFCIGGFEQKSSFALNSIDSQANAKIENNKESNQISIEMPMKITTGSEYITHKMFKFLYIQSTQNNLIINKVELNRGNCSRVVTMPAYDFPVLLNYGEKLNVILKLGEANFCDLLEASVHTNKGTFSYK